MEIKSIDVELPDGQTVAATLEIGQTPPWHLVFSGPGWQRKEFVAPDLFEALILLRLELERSGARLLCHGARPEVFPSSMSRDMGGGRMAYVNPDQPPNRSGELVDIFERADSSQVGSVHEQQAFRDRWIAAIMAIASAQRNPPI